MAAATVLTVPGVVAAVAAVRYGWQPVADEGTIVTRAHDVFTARTPLLGQLSLTTVRGGDLTHSPGPLLYWLLAVPVRLGPIATVPVAMTLVNTACLVGTAAVVARWGGRIALAATTVGLLVLVRAWGGYQLFAPWNPSAALLPFVAMVAVAWAVTCGAHRLLAVVVVLASFCVQSHLTFLAPSAWVTAVAGAAVVVPPVVDGLRRRPPAPDLRDRLRAVALAAGAGLVCWSAPLVDQLRNPPGNAVTLARSLRVRTETLGAWRGSNVVSRVLAGPPVWLRAEGTSQTGFFELDVPVPGLAQVVAVAVGAVLVLVTVRAARRGDRPLASIGLIVSGLLALGWVVAARIPSERAVILGYALWWVSAVGIAAWLVASGGLVHELLGRRRRRSLERAAVGAAAEDPPDRSAPGAGTVEGLVRRRPAVLGIVAVLALGGLAAVTLPLDEDVAWAYEPARQVGDAAVAAAEPGQRYLVSFGRLQIDLAPPVGYRLRAAGAEPVLPQTMGPSTGEGYTARGERCDGIFRLLPVEGAARTDRPPSELTLLELVVEVPRQPATRYVLTLSPDDGTTC